MTTRRLGLGDESLLHALGIAGAHGPRSPMMRCIDHPTMLKDGSAGAAVAEVAALLARGGFTGRPAATVEDSDCGSFWEAWASMAREFLNHTQAARRLPLGPTRP